MAELWFPVPQLAGDVVLLRPWGEADVPGMVLAFSDPVMQRFSWRTTAFTETDARDYFAEQEEARLRGEELNFALAEPRDQDVYRTLDTTIAQNQQRKERRLTLPVLGIGGQYSLGEQVANTMKLAADDVQTLVVPGCAHWVPEEAPEETLAALTAFLAPYRNGPGS